MRKILIYLSSDGLLNTLMFIVCTIREFFYHNSHTICLYADKSDIIYENKNIWNKYDYKILRSAEEISKLNFKRLSLLPYKEWLNAGSFVCVIFDKTRPVAFGWAHFKHHLIKYVGDFDLGNHIAWLGPQFVHKKYRGLGLQKMILQKCISETGNNIQAVISSVNYSNKPSLRSFEKLNFHCGLSICTKTGMFASKSSQIEVLEPDSSNYLKIKG